MGNPDIIKFYDLIVAKSPANILSTGRYISSGFGYTKRLAKDIEEKLELNEKDNVLDIGCNVGIYHRYLQSKVKYLLGVDAGENIIRTAKRNNRFENVDYIMFDAISEWPDLNCKFSKILLYSIIHFIESTEQLNDLLRKLRLNMPSVGKVLLGEVRTEEKYGTFLRAQKEKTKLTLRDFKFILNKYINSVIFKGIKSGYPCTAFKSDEIISLANKHGFQATELDQRSFHPFYKTCSDFLLEKIHP